MWRNNTASLIFVRLRSFILHFLVSTDFKNALSWTAIACCCKKKNHKNIKIQLHLKINCLQDKRTQNSMCYSSHQAKHPDCCHTQHNEWQQQQKQNGVGDNNNKKILRSSRWHVMTTTMTITMMLMRIMMMMMTPPVRPSVHSPGVLSPSCPSAHCGLLCPR